MKIAAIVVVVGLLVIGLGLGIKAISIRNELVRMRNDIQGTWAQVDVNLQRRADLIPGLVETVRGYAKHEKEVIQSVADARARLAGAQTPQERIQANGQLDSALARLLVVVENYPNLKADENFRGLQYELAGTENRIAQARRRYNEAIQRYNTHIELFPNNMAASIFNFSRNDDYFKTEPGARTAPKFQF